MEADPHIPSWYPLRGSYWGHPVRRAFPAVVLLLLGSVDLGRSAAEEPPRPPTLVPNRVAEAWEALEPGAWVRHQEFEVAQDGTLVLVGERLTVLMEKGAHEVIVRRGVEGALAGPEKISWTWDQADRIDRKIEPHSVFGPIFHPGQDVKMTEGRETREVAGEPMECTTLEGGGGERLQERFKLWFAPGVPGGVVREEWSTQITRRTGLQLFRVREYLSGGAKPDGRFAGPDGRAFSAPAPPSRHGSRRRPTHTRTFRPRWISRLPMPIPTGIASGHGPGTTPPITLTRRVGWTLRLEAWVWGRSWVPGGPNRWFRR